MNLQDHQDSLIQALLVVVDYLILINYIIAYFALVFVDTFW